MLSPLQFPRLARFEGLELDLNAGELRKGTQRIRLQEKPFQMLRILLEHSGEVVTRDEIQKTLWPGGTVVEFDHSIATALKKLRQSLGDDADHPRYIETLPRRGYRWIAGVEWVESGDLPKGSDPGDETIDSIAVLPFVNLGGDPEQDYFCDGLAEEILNALTRIPGLRVTARTSSFSFRGKDQDIRQIGQALNVKSVLEGSIRRSGDRFRITLQLIDAGNGYHLWSESYDREMTGVFTVQEGIAGAVTRALRGKFKGELNPAEPYEPSLAAWEAYLKGRHRFSSGSPDGLARAREYFEEAIALDPQWAEPHRGLGAVLYYLAVRGVHPIGEMVPLARGELRKALDLLPSDPAPHAFLGALAAAHDYAWNEAEEHFRLAMASGSPPAWVRATYLQYYLTPLGRFDEAIEECAKVIALDPVNIMNRMMEAFVLVGAGRYDSAITRARMALALDDTCHWAYGTIAHSCFFLGKPAEARKPAEEAFRLAPWDRVTTAFLAGLLKVTGEEERARELLATIGGIVPAGAMFLYHIVCSEIDSAIDWYERAVETRQPGAAIFAFSDFVKPLRAHPRWPTLAKMMNLPGTVP